MDANKLLVRLAAVNRIANEYLDPDIEVRHAKNSDVERWSVPFTLYDIKLDYDKFGDPVSGQVIPVQITRYGINSGCSSPTVSFFDNEFKRNATGPVGLFYLRPENAQDAIDLTIKFFQREQAQKELSVLVSKYLSYILESVDVAKLTVQLKQLDSN